MANPARYLLPTERPVINIRRHWAVLAGITLQSLLLFAAGVLVARILSGIGFAQMVVVWFCVFVVARWIWVFADWYVEKLVVTDKRLLLLTGILARNVAIMPLVKVTDLTFHRSATGMTLGYGKFVVESAGQEQALSTIDFVPQPEKLYIQISELLFGGDKGAPGALVTAAQREAEEEKDLAVRRRWRRFARRRRPEPDERPGPARSTPTPSQLDQILAHRDQVLLADRDDPDWDGRDWDGRDRDGRDRDGRDRDGPDYRLNDRDLGDPRGTDQQDWDEQDRPEPTVELPRFHKPRRSGEQGRDRSDVSRPPPRRRRDTPPPAGTDPIDD
ncbi:MAG: PH domain-containing protein [Mycobacteriales bacterium]